MTDEAEFTVKLNDKVTASAKSASRSLGQLRETAGGFAGVGRKADKATRGFSRSLGGARRSSRSFGGSLGGIFDVFAGNLLTSAVRAMGGMTAGIFASAKEMATFGQNSKFAMEQLTKPGVAGDKLLEHASALAVRFGLDLTDTTDAYRDLLKLQFNPKAIDDMIRMGADLRGLGADAEQVKGIFLAMGQIKSNQFLQGDELNQLAERGVDKGKVWEQIGKIIGERTGGPAKTVAEVQQLQSARKIDSALALEGIKRTVNLTLKQTHLGETGAKFADTTAEGQAGRIKAMAEVAGMGALKDVAAPITKELSGARASFEAWLNSAEGQNSITEAAKALGTLTTAAIKAAEAIGKAFWKTGTTIGDGIAKVDSVISKVANVALTAGGADLSGKTQVKGTKQDWAKADKALNASLQDSGVLDFAAAGFKVGWNMMWGMAEGMHSAQMLPVTAATTVASAAVGATESFLGIQSPSKVFAELGRFSGEGFTLGLKSTTGDAHDAGATIADSSTAAPRDIWGPATSSATAQPAIDPSAVGRGGGNSVTVHITNEINGAAEPTQVASMTSDKTRRDLEDFFRQLELET